MKRDIGGMIRATRKHNGLTQSDLGERIGASASAVCELETGGRKSAVSPEEALVISDALKSSQLLQHYCVTCPVRDRISVRKFRPLNNIVTGVLPAALKNIQKLTEASEMLQRMVPKLLSKGFESCPDFVEFRNEVVLKAIDVRRGLEILFDQMMEAGKLTDSDLKILEDVQQRLCVEKGHHLEEAL